MESIVDGALALLASGSNTSDLIGMTVGGGSSSVISDTVSVLSSLSGVASLISQASSLGSVFESVYKKLTGTSFGQQVSEFWNGVPQNTPEITFQACEKLSDDIKKALAAVHTEPVDTTNPSKIPYTCTTTGTKVQCSEEFIKSTQDSMKKLQDEIDNLTCQIHSKEFEKRTFEYTFNTCAAQLNDVNTQCKKEQEAASKPPAAPPASTPPALPVASSCGCKAPSQSAPLQICAAPTPPPAPTATSCGCKRPAATISSCATKKPARKKMKKSPKKKSCGIDPKQDVIYDYNFTYPNSSYYPY